MSIHQTAFSQLLAPLCKDIVWWVTLDPKTKLSTRCLLAALPLSKLNRVWQWRLIVEAKLPQIIHNLCVHIYQVTLKGQKSKWLLLKGVSESLTSWVSPSPPPQPWLTLTCSCLSGLSRLSSTIRTCFFDCCLRRPLSRRHIPLKNDCGLD